MSSEKPRSFWGTLPGYLMVGVTMVYSYVTYEMLTVLERSNEPIISIAQDKIRVVKAKTEDELWLIGSKFKNGGNTTARQLEYYIWIDNSIEGMLDLTKVDLSGPFSIAPGGEIVDFVERAKATVNQEIKEGKEIYRHSIAFYQNADGKKYSSGLTEKLNIKAIKDWQVVWEFVKITTGEELK